MTGHRLPDGWLLALELTVDEAQAVLDAPVASLLDLRMARARGKIMDASRAAHETLRRISAPGALLDANDPEPPVGTVIETSSLAAGPRWTRRPEGWTELAGPPLTWAELHENYSALDLYMVQWGTDDDDEENQDAAD